MIKEEDFTSYSQIPGTSQEVLEQLISSLMQEKSRVQTRGFLHVLSQLGEVDPKVHKWLQHLDNLGGFCAAAHNSLLSTFLPFNQQNETFLVCALPDFERKTEPG